MSEPRPDHPLPDPLESVLNSSRPAFGNPAGANTAPVGSPSNWLPDASPASQFEETDLEPEDELDPAQFNPCPARAPFYPKTRIAECAAEIAQWAHVTYEKLVQHRLKVYNKYRRRLNEGDTSPDNLGKYRRACRLACEQILRRDLPYLKGFAWDYWDTTLPIFEIALEITRGEIAGALDYELVSYVKIMGVVEVRQHSSRNDPGVPPECPIGDDSEWSSSSSSSSSSGGGPEMP